MIRKGDIPTTDPKENKFLNKFIGKNGEGYRGELIATNQKKDQAVILHGIELILVKELDPNEYPTEIKTICKLDRSFQKC